MTFWSHRIVSTIVSVNSGLCLRVFLSTQESVNVGACLFASVPLVVWPYDILPT